MNLDIIVKPSNDGRFTVACANFPDCESEGASLEEALDNMIDKISDLVAGNIKASLKNSFKELARNISENGLVDVPFMMTKLPISLN